MLKSLVIKNYALIEKLEIEPGKGLNIVTGETGAGKSIMLGALSLLQGNRADTKALFDDQKKCVVEGTFKLKAYNLKGLFNELELDYEPVSVIRREISPSGKSRAFVNDTPTRLEDLRQLTAYLMDIHSQHDTLLLAANDFQRTLVDAFAQNEKIREQYGEAYDHYQKVRQQYRQLLQEHEKMTKEHDFNLHQLQELEAANLDGIILEDLESELEKSENAESIVANLNASLESLSRSDFSVEQGLKTVLSAFSQIENYSSKYAQLKERVQSSLIELSDVVLEIEKEESDIFLDPQQLQTLRERLDEVYTLQKKHRVETLDELLQIRDTLKEKVEAVANFDEDLERLGNAQKLAEKTLNTLGEQLTTSRKSVVPSIAHEMDELFLHVGMPNARFDIQIEPQEPAPDGADLVTFLFTANKGIAPRELRSVASGGEFSRLMLCLKYVLASRAAMPTIIFDEIDTGISGEIAIKVGKMMRTMAQGHQLIAISHLPQIAALGTKHYFVYKDHSAERSVSRVRELSKEERVREIAEMIGGQNPSETAFRNARELMGA